MNWLGIGKALLGGVVSIGIGNIVGNIVKSTTPANLNTFNKVSIQIGAFVLSGAVSARAIEYMNNEIDSVVDQVYPRKEQSNIKSEKTNDMSKDLSQE